MFQQCVGRVREGIKDIFGRHDLPVRKFLVEGIYILGDVVEDVEGRGEIAGRVSSREAVAFSVLDNDLLRGAYYPDRGAATVATYIYSQTAAGPLLVRTIMPLLFEESASWVIWANRTQTHASSRPREVPCPW